MGLRAERSTLNNSSVFLRRAHWLLVLLALTFASSRGDADTSPTGTPVAILGVVLNPTTPITDLTVTAYCRGAAGSGQPLNVPAPVASVPTTKVQVGNGTFFPRYYYLYGMLPASTCTLKYTRAGQALLTQSNVPVGGSQTTDIMVTMDATGPTTQTRREAQVFEPYIGPQAAAPSATSNGTPTTVFESPTPNPCFALNPPQGFSGCMTNVEPQFLADLFVRSLNSQCQQNIQLAQNNVDRVCTGQGAGGANCLIATMRLTQAKAQCGAPTKPVVPKDYFRTGVFWFKHPPYDPKNYNLGVCPVC